MMRVSVIHGPNLNLLGLREPEIYGSQSLEEVNQKILDAAQELGIEVRLFQSNMEGEIVEAIHNAYGWADAIIINPAGYTHYSVVIRDAIEAVRLPTIEVHLSNIYSREQFRRHSMTYDVVYGQITGFGWMSYVLALRAAKHIVEQMRK
jgi:3-dehydroquinate dehydratase-2